MDYEPKLEKKTQCHCPDSIKTEGICNITKDITGSEDKRSYLALYIAAAVSVFLIVLIPGSAYFFVKRSKQRGEAKFPDLLGSSSKVWPLHSPHEWPNEINNSNNLETTVKDAIRPANDNRVVNLDGVETGKTDV
ncbi:uncharacterized protein [Magallana gigas]|uniref:uncharacterized protein n=1 Tax=Magallana gigas TaxID=29159 RepID=UPI00333F2A0E